MEADPGRGHGPRVHLVASGGGHLDLLRDVAGVFAEHDRTWVTVPGRAAGALRVAGERVLEVPPFDRRNRGIANLRVSLRLAARERPELVVTSGAGIAVAFTGAARARGARVVFAETMARVRDSSVSGRVLARLAGRTLVQWEEMVDVHPRAVTCRPALLEDLPHGPAERGAGTFVALGTHHQRFGRLLSMVERAMRDGVVPQPVHVQAGATPLGALPGAATLPPEEMRERISGADLVVCHGGAGIIATTLRSRRRPLVLPRLARHDEHVDDHQEQITAKLGELGLAVPLSGAITAADVAATRAPIPAPGWPLDMPTVSEALARAVA
jgi:UDP-N-acetylglucosamine--N-acetylmuramyl-(pentapeptide) pyrophosphoryl-undecaprenol N-acetylglucosamine transferase